MRRPVVWALAVAGALLAGDARAADPPKSIWKAADQASADKPLAAGAVASRELLLAIAEHESRFSEKVARCKVRGDGGRAHGTYQLHPEAFGGHDASEVCASDALQARLALAVLRRGEAMGGLEHAVHLYASGRPRPTKASREILAMFRRRMKALGRR